MPQMAPMNWIMLYMTFTFIFYLFYILIFFNFFKKNFFFSKENKTSLKKINWKW